MEHPVSKIYLSHLKRYKYEHKPTRLVFFLLKKEQKQMGPVSQI